MIIPYLFLTALKILYFIDIYLTFMSMFQKIIIVFLCLLLLIVSTFFLSLWFKTKKEYQGFANREQKLSNELCELQSALKAQELYLDKLISDPEFFERVVRQKLGYSSPNELIFRFPNQQTQ